MNSVDVYLNIVNGIEQLLIAEPSLRLHALKSIINQDNQQKVVIDFLRIMISVKKDQFESNFVNRIFSDFCALLDLKPDLKDYVMAMLRGVASKDNQSNVTNPIDIQLKKQAGTPLTELEKIVDCLYLKYSIVLEDLMLFRLDQCLNSIDDINATTRKLEVEDTDYKPKKFEAMLVDTEIITPEQWQQVLAEYGKTGRHIAQILVDLLFVTQEESEQLLELYYGYSHLDLSNHTILAEALIFTSKQDCLKGKLIPVSYDKVQQVLTIAMDDPHDTETLTILARKLAPITVRPVHAYIEGILQAIKKYY